MQWFRVDWNMQWFKVDLVCNTVRFGVNLSKLKFCLDSPNDCIYIISFKTRYKQTPPPPLPHTTLAMFYTASCTYQLSLNKQYHISKEYQTKEKLKSLVISEWHASKYPMKLHRIWLGSFSSH